MSSISNVLSQVVRHRSGVHLQQMDEERDQMPGERAARLQHGDGLVRLYQRCEYPQFLFESPL